MQDRGDWGADPARYCPVSNNIKRRLIVHHSAGYRPRSSTEEKVTLRNIQDFHFGRGWSDIAYNFGAHRYLGLTQLRGFFCLNGANTPANDSTFSIVLLGHMSLNQITDEEKNVILDLADYLNIAPEACPGGCAIGAHQDISATACPGDSTMEWLNAGHPRPKACVC